MCPSWACGPGIKEIARLHDRRTSAHEVTRDLKFADHIVGIDARSATRHARNKRQRLQMHQQVPRAAKDHRLLALQAVRACDRHRCLDRAHSALSVTLARLRQVLSHDVAAFSACAVPVTLTIRFSSVIGTGRRSPEMTGFVALSLSGI